MKNHQWIVKAPFYVNCKKHYCPTCHVLLRVVKESKVVSAGSSEAAKLGLSYSMVGGVYQSGEINVIWKEFECPKCKQRITIDKMKEIEGCK